MSHRGRLWPSLPHLQSPYAYAKGEQQFCQEGPETVAENGMKRAEVVARQNLARCKGCGHAKPTCSIAQGFNRALTARWVHSLVHGSGAEMPWGRRAFNWKGGGGR